MLILVYKSDICEFITCEYKKNNILFLYLYIIFGKQMEHKCNINNINETDYKINVIPLRSSSDNEHKSS